MKQVTPVPERNARWVAPEKLSDAQIAKLTSEQREDAAEQFVERGKAYSGNADYKRSLPYFETAVKLDPENFDAFNSLGSALYKLGRFKDAVEQLRSALILDSRNNDARSTLAQCYLKLNYNEDARRILEDLTRESPSNDSFQYSLGLAYKALGRDVPAIAAFRKAASLNSHNVDANVELARLLHKTDDADGVLETFVKVLDEDPEAAKALKKELGLTNVPLTTKHEVLKAPPISK